MALAHALEGLPALREAMQLGVLSLDKAAAVASMATADSEAELAAETTANQLARILAATRRALHPAEEAEESARQRRERFLDTWWERGMLSVRGRLPAEEGAVFRKALEKAVDLARREAAATGFEDEPPEAGEEPPLVDPLADADKMTAAAGR